MPEEQDDIARADEAGWRLMKDFFHQRHAHAGDEGDWDRQRDIALYHRHPLSRKHLAPTADLVARHNGRNHRPQRRRPPTGKTQKCAPGGSTSCFDGVQKVPGILTSAAEDNAPNP
jgi:hypothetical protein